MRGAADLDPDPIKLATRKSGNERGLADNISDLV
jgi:hypothetical protein